MPKMFGVRYAVVKGSCVLDELIKEKIVVSHPITLEYLSDKHAVAGKDVNKDTVKNIAQALSNAPAKR